MFKLANYIIALSITAFVANAETITDQELQERFNKAFSVFNQNTSEANVQEIIKKEESEPEIITTKPSQTNIIKSYNKDQIIESEEQPIITDNYSLPHIPVNMEDIIISFTNLSNREILIDMQNATLKQIVQEALNQAAINEKWQLKWRLKDENKYILNEKMNLTAEVTFDSFIGNMIETINNITGIRLSTKVFNKNKIIIITDSF